MNCAGALNLIDLLDLEGKVDWSSNEYAAYGTVAHEIAATFLETGGDAWEIQGEEREHEGFVFEVDQEMVDLIQHYLDVVRADLQKYGGTLHVEKKEVLEHVDEECGGTMDAGFLGADNWARVYDLKTGFVIVDEERNKQQMIYGLELVLKVLNMVQLKAVKGIELIIVQARGFGAAPVRRYQMTLEELLAFQDEELVPAIAATKDPEAPRTFGKWCTRYYCKAAGHCPEAIAKASEVIEQAQVQPAERLNAEECGEILELKAICEAYFKAVKTRAFGFLLKNETVPGQKLVLGIKHQQWKSDAMESVPEDLADEGIERKMKTPAQFKKLGPKAAEFVAEWSFKPKGELTMAGADDRRKAEKAPETNPNETFKDLID
jgi:hypothetical protein